MDESFIEKSGWKYSKLSLFIIGELILLLSIALGSYVLFINTPKNVFVSSINTIYKEITNTIYNYQNNEINKLSKDNVIVSNTNITIDTNNKLNDFSNSLDGMIINYIYSSDIKNKKILFNFNAQHDKSDLLNFELYGENNLAYVYIEKVFNKYIKVDNIDLSTVNKEDTTKDMKYLSDKTLKLLFDSLKEKYFTKSKAKIDIYNKKVSANKNTLTLTDEIMTDICINILEGLEADAKAIDALVNIEKQSNNKITKEDVAKNLNDAIKEIKNDKEEPTNDKIYISVYTKGLLNKIVKLETEIITNIDNKTSNINITYLEYKKDNKDIGNLKYKEDNKELMDFTIEKGKTTKYNLFINYLEKQTMNLSWEVEKQFKEIVKDKEFETIINTNFMYTDSKRMEYIIGFKSNTNTKIGGVIKKTYNADSVDIDQLTEEEQSTIYEKLYMLMYELMGYSEENNVDNIQAYD